MKSFFIMQDSLENKISFYHLAFFLAVLPFDRFYSELILVSLTLHAVIHLNKQKFQGILTWQNLLSSSAILITFVGIAWSQYKEQALKDIVRQSAIFLFPLILSATGLQLSQYRKFLLTFFGSSCTIAILYLYADAFHIILYDHLPLNSLFKSYFINHSFSSPIGMHATYLAMYTSLSLAVFTSFILEEKNKKYWFFYAIALIILFAGLLQLASKSVLITILIFISIVLPIFLLQGKRRIIVIITSLVISAIIVFGLTRIDSLRKRYVVELKDDLADVPFSKDIPEPRLIRWQYALQLIRQSPIIGYGSGSEKALLMEKYFDNKLYTSYLKELNVHNQYLSFIIKMGLCGLIIFLISIVAGFILAWRTRDIIFANFMLLITIVSFSENILDVNKGIFFYAFFFSFFILSSKPFKRIPRFSNESLVLSN